MNFFKYILLSLIIFSITPYQAVVIDLKLGIDEINTLISQVFLSNQEKLVSLVQIKTPIIFSLPLIKAVTFTLSKIDLIDDRCSAENVIFTPKNGKLLVSVKNFNCDVQVNYEINALIIKSSSQNIFGISNLNANLELSFNLGTNAVGLGMDINLIDFDYEKIYVKDAINDKAFSFLNQLISICNAKLTKSTCLNQVKKNVSFKGTEGINKAFEKLDQVSAKVAVFEHLKFTFKSKFLKVPIITDTGIEFIVETKLNVV